jgi:uncharacterized protein YjbI with pentapeptide repeats
LRNVDLQDADLCGANLRNANLQDADLHHANLCGADTARARGLISLGCDKRGYDFFAVQQAGGYFIYAGCRWLSADDAETHWSRRHEDDPELRAEILAKLTLAKTVAEEKGWA